VTPDLAGPEDPVLREPLPASTGGVPLGSALMVSLALGVVAGLIGSPIAGLTVALGTGIVLRYPRARLLLATLAVVFVLAAGVYVTVSQAVWPAKYGGGWPTGFGTASVLAWTGIMLLGADAAVDVFLAWTARRRFRGGPSDRYESARADGQEREEPA
jgi:hypothetical protein